ncbi:hypothetical protein MVI27_07645 [Chryseobacterium salipaludis]|uniref:hypothetical protein n=1 Tax=Chryseobacterium TaxID=59732 RepID=UPI001FF2F152|nr:MULTISPECIES: hypothetical protein [Chryseobacterium]MCJ8498130.1 hypothetical protein [Chryseobacterium salipaludis]MCX3296672.1 hypothetical protein [Planobacterium sp. JC490]
MKEANVRLETYFWATEEIDDPFKVFSAFFEFYRLDSSKDMLSEVMRYLHKDEVCGKENPSRIFDFHKALQSFARAAYLINLKKQQWKVKKGPEAWPVMAQASLTAEEYENPQLVFEKAFAASTLDEYEFFLNEICYIALMPYREQADYDLTTPYIWFIKMLDAAQVITERGVEKVGSRKFL